MVNDLTLMQHTNIAVLAIDDKNEVDEFISLCDHFPTVRVMIMHKSLDSTFTERHTTHMISFITQPEQVLTLLENTKPVIIDNDHKHLLMQELHNSYHSG